MTNYTILSHAASPTSAFGPLHTSVVMQKFSTREDENVPESHCWSLDERSGKLSISEYLLDRSDSTGQEIATISMQSSEVQFVSTPDQDLRNTAVKLTAASPLVVEDNRSFSSLQLIQEELIRINKNRLAWFKTFKKGWDKRGAKVPDKKLLEWLESFIEKLNPQPEIFPTADGRIQLEYESNDRSLIFYLSPGKKFMEVLDSRREPGAQVTRHNFTQKAIKEIVVEFFS